MVPTSPPDPSAIPNGQPTARPEAVRRVVEKHLNHPLIRPLSNTPQPALDAIVSRLRQHDGPVYLDTGCGDGTSSRRLASAHPGVLVIGLDKSAHRLSKHSGGDETRGNLYLRRVELVDFWLWAAKQKLLFDRCYLLYPNPWPKSKHLLRRWYAHPIFPAILATATSLELQSNWSVYIDEFAIALETALGPGSRPRMTVQRIDSEDALTPFAEKYARSGHPRWKLSIIGSPGLPLRPLAS